MGKPKRPEIGAKLYAVHEHLYKNPGERVGWHREYCVCEHEVTGYFQGGYTEICTRFISPEGFPTPMHYKLSALGKEIFYTPQEAAELAKVETEDYERRWSWLPPSEIPLRRPWAELLEATP